MSAANSKDQAEQSKRPRLNPDFSHRLAAVNVNDIDNLTDSIVLMADRLASVLLLLSVSLYEGITIDNGAMAIIVDGAILEAEDIKSLIKAFSEQEYAKRGHKKTD